MPGEHRLEGVHVLVTRPRERSGELCFLLEDEGASVTCLPLLELLPPLDPRPLKAAAEQVGRYRWVLLASPSAVQALVEAVREAGAAAQLGRCRIAVVGPGTARAVKGYGFEVAREASESTGLGLFEALKGDLAPEDEVLLPVAEEGRAELHAALLERGVRVVRVCAYRSVKAGVEPAVVAALAARPPRVILFGSPRTAEAFLESLGDAGRRLAEGAKVIAIGPTTASALEQLGLHAAAVAPRPTPEGLVDAAISAIRG